MKERAHGFVIAVHRGGEEEGVGRGSRFDFTKVSGQEHGVPRVKAAGVRHARLLSAVPQALQL